MKKIFHIAILFAIMLPGTVISQVTTHTGELWNMRGINKGAWDLISNIGRSSGESATLKDMINTTTVATGGTYGFAQEWTVGNATLFVKDNAFDYTNTTNYNAVAAAYAAGTPVSTCSNIQIGDIFIAKLRGTTDYATIKITNLVLTTTDNNDKIDFEYKKNFVVTSSYCTADAGTCEEHISNVQVGGINNSSDCTVGGYFDYSGSLSTDMTVGQSYPITITNGWGWADDYCYVWIDWNQDGDFYDAGENVTITGNPGEGPYTGTITVPGGAVLGETKMRIRIAWNEIPDPCGTAVNDYGETEDYSINVVPLSGHQTYYTCSATFYDSGGNGGNYSANEDYLVTYTSANFSCIRAVIDFYEMESLDFLYIYDGVDETGDLLATFSGSSINTSIANTLDDNGTAFYGLSGSLTFRFVSNGSVQNLGWKIYIDCPDNCVAPPCAENELANDFCENSTPLCNLNGYCGNTSSLYTIDHSEMDWDQLGIFCGTIENNSWLSFIAEDDTAKVDVWTKNCTTGKGIQIQIYTSNCNNSAFVAKSNCWSPRKEANGVITATGLVPGQEYLIMIDGWGADACEYSFAASSGVVIADAGQDHTICEGQVVTLSASGGTGYQWSTGQVTQTINVSPSVTTVYTVTVTGTNPNCPGNDDVTVFVNSASANFSGLAASYCVDNSSGISLIGDYPTSISSFSGPGISNDSIFTPSVAGTGTHNITYTYDYSVVTAFFDDFDPQPNAGWTHGGSAGDSWAWGIPHGGNGTNTNTSSNPDPVIDHSSNINNNVYGQGLSATTGDGLGGHYDSSNEWLLSPAIDCSDLTNSVLSYWRYANFEYGWDNVSVKVCTTAALNEWFNLGEELYPQDDHWTQRIFDLSIADGEPVVYIRWQSVSDGSQTYSGWNIDDITISGVTSGGSCTSTETQTTTVYPKPTSSFTLTNPLCSYSTATATYTGNATPAATYNWNFGSASTTGSGQGPYSLTYASSGTYSVSLSVSQNGCNSTSTSHSTVVPTAITINETVTNASCGNSNGSIVLSVSGGTSPYGYSWSSGQATSSISGVNAGSYTVTVTDNNGCTKTKTISISNQGGPTLTLAVNSDVQCYNQSTGSITANATGGIAPYTYNWNNGSTTATISNLQAGYYYVTVTAYDGCVATANTQINQPTQLSVTANGTNVSCYNQYNGAVNLSVSGGVTPYSYNWSSGHTTQNISSLGPNTYNVTITDANSCTTTATANITEPSAITVSGNATNVVCYNQANGSISLTVSGGIGPYSYGWSNSSTLSSISNLSPGTYTVTVTDNNSCTKQTPFTITQPAAVSETHYVNGATCNGLSDASLNLTPGGGVSPYQFSWSNGSTTEDLNGISGGNYFVTITDANNCTMSTGINVPNPATINVSYNVTHLICNGLNTGFIDVTTSGGTPNYTYHWTGPNAYSSNPSGGDISGLYAGDYFLTVTDANGCTSTGSTTVNEPSNITVTPTISQSTCGSSDGSISIIASGGTPSYSYNWSSGSGSSSITNLSSGSYTVTVTDANYCSTIESFSINDQGGPTATSSGTNVTCPGQSNGSVSLSVSGGLAPYTYSWSPGIGTSSSATGLNGGNYFYTVTDQNSCIATGNVVVTEPATISGTLTPTNITCNGSANGSIDLAVTGGTMPYSYSWNNGATMQDPSGLAAGNYEVTITDANNCIASFSGSISEPAALSATLTPVNSRCYNSDDGTISTSVSGGTSPYTYLWSPVNSTVSQLTNLSPGTYSVTIKDVNNCQITSSSSTSEPGELSVAETVSSPACSGLSNGSINLSVSGGTPSYSFNWSNGATTEDISSISAGTYDITITDQNNCSVIDLYTVTQPSALSATLNKTNAQCYGQEDGSISPFVSGGTPSAIGSAYNFSWSNGATTEEINSIGAGSYSVTITDANSCSIVSSATISQPTQIQLSMISSNSNCGVADGSAGVSASGGNSPYSYLWNNGVTNSNVTGIYSGAYTVTVTDAQGCTSSSSVNVTDNDAPTGSITPTNATCFGYNNGGALVSASGGSGALSYLWTGGQTSTNVTGLSAGNYNVTITDALNCQIVLSTTITQPTQLIVSSAVTDISCAGSNNGAIDLTVTGGTFPPPYQYYWEHGSNIADQTNLSQGNYTVTVVDGNNCYSIQSFVIDEPDALNLIINASNPLCFGNTDASATAIINGGTPAYSLLWSTGSSSILISDLTPGIYTATVTDSKGCSSEASTEITTPTEIDATMNITNVIVAETATGAIDMDVIGGQTPYTYYWSNGASTQDLSDLAEGQYLVTITDYNGCRITDTAVISAPDSLLGIYYYSIDTIKCYGDNTGTIDLIVGGGSGSYSYEWSNGSTTEDINDLYAGEYSVVVTDGFGITTSGSFVLTQPDSLFIFEISSTPAGCEYGEDGTATVVIDGGTKPYSVEWSTSPPVYDTIVTGLSEGDYSVTVTDANHCEITGTIYVDAIDVICLFIPDLFTPNDDNNNDFFEIRGIEYYPDASMEIYNRWGDLMYRVENNYYDQPWDGTFNNKPQPINSYVFILDLKNGKEPINGVVTIVR